MVLLSAALVGLAVLALLGRPSSARLRRALGPPVRSGRGHAGAALPSPRLPAPVLACGLAGAAVALLVQAPLGLVLGVALAVAGPRALGRLEPQAVRDERRRLVAELPLVLDLLASCLAGGAALPDAAAAVAAAVPGPAGDRLASVVAMLAVGAPPLDAWAALAGSDPEDPLAAAGRALARAADGGAPVAASVGRLAADARAQGRAAAEQAARRVGVLVVAPLGLCFLPAFVLLGVVPVVAGLAGPLLAT